MTKIYTTLILLCFNFLIIIGNEKQNTPEQGKSLTESPYRPLVMIKRTYFNETGQESSNFYFPEKNEENEDPNNDSEMKEEKIYLCPPESEIQEMKSSSKRMESTEYCLLEKKFQENEERSCKSQVKPILIPDRSGHIFGCHFNETAHIYTFAIQNCTGMEAPREEENRKEDEQCFTFIKTWITSIFEKGEKELINPNYKILYYICYDTSTKKTKWTLHTIISPLSLENENWLDKPPLDSTKLSTEPYTLPNRFLEINDAFEKQNKESTNYMVPRMLVPKDDMPYEIWKVATSHYINISAIQRKLEPLMDAIDNGIRKAAITLKKRLLRKNSMFLDKDPFNVHNLQIYTKPYTLQENIASKFLNNNKTLPIPDIWCKMIYYEQLHRGIAIFVHNTLNGHIDEQIKQCDKQTFCDFQEWAKHKFDEELSKYAYCCIITKKLVNSIFPYTDLRSITQLLNIEDLIEGDPQYPLDHPLTLRRHSYKREDIENYNLTVKMNMDNPHSNREIAKSESEEIFLCPVEKLDDQEIIEYIGIRYWGFKVCLIEKNFTHEETKICEKEVEPILILDEEHSGNPRKCGSNKKDSVMKFVYVYCYDSHKLNEMKKHIEDEPVKKQYNKKAALLDEIPTIEILYNVCYNNVEMRTSHTMHRITSPSLLRLDNNTYKCKKISSESYNMNEKFSDMRIVLKHFIKFGQDRMAPQMLVPPEDFVLPLWKKTTCHFSNISLIWDELVPFMNRINTQIRKWAIDKSRELKVFTITFEYNGINQQEQHSSSNVKLNELFPIPKMWGKMVLDEEDGLGVAIFIHNTPGHPPESSEFCEKAVECNFENWSTDLMQSDNSIQKEHFKYAYCCEVTYEIKSIYGKEELEIKGVLDLNTLNDILEGNLKE